MTILTVIDKIIGRDLKKKTVQVLLFSIFQLNPIKYFFFCLEDPWANSEYIELFNCFTNSA